MKEAKKNFTKKLNLVCGNDDLRPVLQYVSFQNGSAICTNAHVLVKRSLKLDGFTDEEIEQMNGKFIHKDTYKHLLGFDVVEVIDGAFHCTKGKINSVVSFNDSEGVYPDWLKVIPVGDTIELGEIGIGAKNLELVKSIASDMETRFKFYGANKAVLIKGSSTGWDEEMILIIPLMLHD